MARLTHLSGRLGRGLLPWLLPIAIVTAWEIAARAGWLSSRILPEPFAVVQAGVTLAASGEFTEWPTFDGLDRRSAAAGIPAGRADLLLTSLQHKRP